MHQAARAVAMVQQQPRKRVPLAAVRRRARLGRAAVVAAAPVAVKIPVTVGKVAATVARARLDLF